MNTTIRHAVIRGDATAGGIALVVVAAVVGVSGVGVGPKIAGGLLLVGGLALVRWSRARWRELVAEVVRRHSGVDPGASPAPWISDAVWRKHNRFDPVLDAHNELLAEIDPLLPRFGQGTTRAFEGVALRPVADSERALAPVDPEAADGPAPEPDTADRLLAALAATPGRLIGVGVRFPVCCGRPSTLVSTGAEDRVAGAAFLAEHAGGELGQADPLRGQHGFRCRACGRRYATDPAW
jgi:hypothetical protein